MTRLARVLRLLEYEYFANYKQKQYKIYIISKTGNFTTFSQSLTSKVHSKDVKKRIIFGFFAKFCQNYAGVTYPVVLS